MNWGGPEFVLCIIGMAMFAGVLKSWGRSAHGVDGKRGRKNRAAFEEQNALLLAENARLRDQLEHHEDRLSVLERIVTDSGYGLAREIESLRGK